MFSTLDQDNDVWGGGNCAADFSHGAWWHEKCDASNLNGQYGGPGVSGTKYNVWYYWKNKNEALKGTIMMVRPKR
jgi:hypothetical protein